MKHIFLITTLIFLFNTNSIGQEKLQLSLAEAQDYAVLHNKSLQGKRLEIQASEQKVKETISKGLPQIDATLDWMTYFGYELQFEFGGAPDVTDAQINNAINKVLNDFPGVTQQDFYVYQATQALESELMPADAGLIKMTDASTAKLQVGQLIYSGQFWTGIKVAKLGKTIAEKGLQNSILDIKEAVTNSYYMTLITEQSISTFKRTIESLNKIKEHTNNMFLSGMAEQTDVDQISIQVTMLENNLRSMERGLQMIYSMLKFQLGLDADVEIFLTEDVDKILAILKPTAEVEPFNIENNTTYQLIETQEKISEKLVDMERMAYTPTVTGFYAYNQKLLTTGFDMTPNNVAGVTLSLPVFSSGSRKHKVEQAKIELDKNRLNKSMLEDQLKLQQKQLLLDLNSAIENYNSQKENVKIAKRVYTSYQNKYEQGIVSSLELTQSNSNYLEAESNYIQSIMSLLQAKVAIDKLYNQL